MTSRFARLGLRTKIVSVAILAILPMVVPSVAAAQTDTKTPISFEINSVHKFLTGKSDVIAGPPAPVIDPNVAILEDYLTKKNSPLAPYAENILQYEHWKLVLAISNGESTMCKHQRFNNCWGVGGAWNLRRYESFIAGFSDVNRFLGEMYIAKGADTPQEIVRKYVGSYSPNWVVAVSQALTQIDQLPLVN